MQAAAAMPGVQYAGFWRRLVATLIDNAVTSAAGGFLGFWLGLVAAATGVGDTAILVLAYTLGFILGLVYYVALWTWRGQTVGKMAMRVRIIKTDGTPITLGTAVLRYVGYIVSTIVLLIGFFMIAWDGKKQGLHDKIAGTYVVKV